jgi:hypothetical protein
MFHHNVRVSGSTQHQLYSLLLQNVAMCELRYLLLRLEKIVNIEVNSTNVLI